ncbi:hypothetical protein VPH35_124937 [Triticum aestivum]
MSSSVHINIYYCTLHLIYCMLSWSNELELKSCFGLFLNLTYVPEYHLWFTFLDTLNFSKFHGNNFAHLNYGATPSDYVLMIIMDYGMVRYSEASDCYLHYCIFKT